MAIDDDPTMFLNEFLQYQTKKPKLISRAVENSDNKNTSDQNRSKSFSTLKKLA